METAWLVTAIYCPKPREVRVYEGRGFRVETKISPVTGQEWSWTVRHAETSEEACEIVRRVWTFKGIEKDFVFYAFRVALLDDIRSSEVSV